MYKSGNEAVIGDKVRSNAINGVTVGRVATVGTCPCGKAAITLKNNEPDMVITQYHAELFVVL